LWNVAMPSERANLHHSGNERPFVTLFTPDSKALLTIGERFVKVWDVATGKERVSWEDTRVLPKLSPDGKTLVFGGSSELKLIDLSNGQERATLTNTSLFRFSPDGKTFATGKLDARNYVTLRQTATGKELATLAHAGLLDVYFSPDGKTLATIGENLKVKLWDMPTTAD
jgi:WD40 repeat protein